MWNIICIISFCVILPILTLYFLYRTQKVKHFDTLKTLNPIHGSKLLIRLDIFWLTQFILLLLIYLQLSIDTKRISKNWIKVFLRPLHILKKLKILIPRTTPAGTWGNTSLIPMQYKSQYQIYNFHIPAKNQPLDSNTSTMLLWILLQIQYH
jgi:hypothetical protein